MRRLLVIPLVLILLLAGSMVWSGGGIEKRADFAFINRGDIYTLDINKMSYQQDFRLTYGIREGLYASDPVTFRPIPAGAVSYDLSDDKRIWTFHLRKESKWSNGDPVRAQDYIFSWRWMLEYPGDYTYLFYYLKNAEAYEKSYATNTPFDFKTVGMEAVDDLTLRLTLDDPVPFLLELVAFPPFYPRNERSMEPFKSTLEGRKFYDSTYTRPPWVVTNGPYVLKQWDFKRRLVLEKSENYWDKANVLSPRIEMVVNDNGLSQYLLYETGQVDWMADVDKDLAAELKAKGRTDLRTSPAFGTAFLTLLCTPELPKLLGGGKNPLSDIRVRQALAMSIDKKFITENISRMGELPARTYLPPDGTLPDFRWLPGPFQPGGAQTTPYTPEALRAMLPNNKAVEGPGLPYDVTTAKKLLADAGYPGGSGFPTLPILWNTDNPARGKIAQAIKDQWKQKLGIDIEVQGIEGKIFHERVSGKDYAIATVAWYGDYPDASTFTDKYLSGSLQNDSDWRNDAFDKMVAESKKVADPEARGAILMRAEHLIDTEMPIIPLYHYVNVSLSRDNVLGVSPNPRALTVFKNVSVKR